MTEARPFYQLSLPERADLAPRVLAVLRQARIDGRHITAADIARQMNYRDERKVRAVIEHLIEQGQTIAASNRDPFGYFLIESVEEAEVYERTLRSRAAKTLKRLANFRRGTERRFGRQLPILLLDQTIKDLDK